MSASARVKGSIKRLVTDRGFGFIVADTGVDYFFHKFDLRSGSGLCFPTDTCLCGHSSYDHARRGAAFGACHPACACQLYVRRQSPGAIYAGKRVSFSDGTDDRGLHAFDVAEE